MCVCVCVDKCVGACVRHKPVCVGVSDSGGKCECTDGCVCHVRVCCMSVFGKGWAKVSHPVISLQSLDCGDKKASLCTGSLPASGPVHSLHPFPTGWLRQE